MTTTDKLNVAISHLTIAKQSIAHAIETIGIRQTESKQLEVIRKDLLNMIDWLTTMDNATTTRCPNHAHGGETRCPRGGSDLQIWQRKQWGE